MVGKGVTGFRLGCRDIWNFCGLYNDLVSVLRRLWTHLVFLTSS